MSPRRRKLLWAAAGWCWADRIAFAAEGWPRPVVELLREGAIVAAFRHAQATGTFDPPGFDLADCRSQRNLDDAGRAQARVLGARFEAAGLKPSAVRSSPWCRCLETARLAFGRVEPWPALGSTRGAGAQPAAQMTALKAALAEVQRGRFEVWVSHQFTLTELTGQSLASAEGLLLRAGAGGDVTVLGRLPAA